MAENAAREANLPIVCQKRSPPLHVSFASTIKHLLPPCNSPSVTIELYDPKWKYFNFRHRSLLAPSIFISIYEFPTRSICYETQPVYNTRRPHHTRRKSFSEKSLCVPPVLFAFYIVFGLPHFIVRCARACGDRKTFEKRLKPRHKK